MALPYIKLFVDPFLADTGELSEAEIGAYFRLLLKMWKAGGRLKNDPEVLRKCAQCAKPSVWGKRWAALSRYFEITPDGYVVNPKLSKERLRALGVTEKRSDAGVAGALARADVGPEKEFGNSPGGNISGPNQLESLEAGSTNADKRAPVQTAQQDVEIPDSEKVVLFPLPQQAAPLDDWPAGNLGQWLDAFAARLDHPWFDPSKDVTLRLRSTAATYFTRWRDAGCSWEADVIPIAVAKCPEARSPIQSMKFFDGPILDAHGRRTAAHIPSPHGDHDDPKLARKNANIARAFAAAQRVAESRGD
jgi:uncharacterized protein YdaU (DUF1376 family)